MSNIATSLKALATTGDGIKRTDAFRVNPNLIQFEEGFNLRTPGVETDAHIERIYLAMKEGASIPAIDVQIVEGVITARDGHCRTRAAQRLLLENPEYMLECRQLRGNDADAVLHMLGTGNGSKPLSPLEQGIGFMRLIKFGLAVVEIAKKLGVSRVTVANGITLAEAPAAVQKMIAYGEVSATTAREAIQQGSEGVKALKAAVKEKRAAGTAKKVTAKKLRGTAADKKTKVKKKKTPVVATTTIPDNLTADEVKIIVHKEVATTVAKFLREMGDDNGDLKTMADALEMALM